MLTLVVSDKQRSGPGFVWGLEMPKLDHIGTINPDPMMDIPPWARLFAGSVSKIWITIHV